MIRFTLFGLALFLLLSASGQKDPLYSYNHHYTIDEGLPQSFVTGLAQDKDGFIWVSTRDGLARFDGQSFTRYAPDEVDSSRQISTNQLNDIYLDQNNQLWVYNFSHKIDKIDLNTGKIYKGVEPLYQLVDNNFKLKVDESRAAAEFFTDDRGFWYSGGNRSYRLFDNSNSMLVDLFKNPIKDTTRINAFSTDQNGFLWTLQGFKYLVQSDRSGEEIFKVEIPKNPHRNRGYCNHASVVGIRYLKGNKLFIQIPVGEGYRAVIFIYDIDLNTFSFLDIPPYEAKFFKYIENFTYAKNGDLIFDYHGHVIRLSEDEKMTLLWSYPFEPTAYVSALLMDRSETLWIGTSIGGLFSVDATSSDFQSFKYQTNFICDILSNPQLSTFPPPLHWKRDLFAYGLRYDYSDSGEILMTNELAYSRSRRIYRNGRLLKEMETFEESGDIIFGLDQKDTNVWAVSQNGFIIKYHDDGELIDEWKFLEPSDDFDKPVDLVVGSEYQWVISANNRLFQLQNGEILETFNPSASGQNLVFLNEDKFDESKLWIGTLGDGLLLWDKIQKKIVRKISKEDGMPNNNMAGMVQDTLGRLWVSTFNGLAKIELASDKIATYNKIDGLYENEFNRHHVFELPDGRIAFGGSKGYTLFNPYELTIEEYQPQVNITEITVNYEPVRDFLPSLQNLVLDYDENSLVVDMAAMQYNDPDLNRYRYQLKGFNDDWVYNEKSRRVRFDKLPPGNYSLMLNASNTNGIWSDHIRQLDIKISRPPWKTWWAIISYLLTAGTVVTIVWRYNKRRIFEKQQLLFKDKEAKRFQEIDAIKTRFFSNITHEFRTPLTLILSPIEKVIRENKYPKEINQLLESNYQQGTKLLELVNQLLDVSKLESGQMQTHKSAGDLALFLKSIVDQFRSYAEQNKIALNFQNEEVAGQYLMDKSHLEKVIANLLSNAIKFSRPGDFVSLILREGDNELVLIEVKDTGEGIPEDQIGKLFDRFYQVDGSDSRLQEGTGIGLSLVKELVDLMGGNISVESRLGDGTSFHLTLPSEKIVTKSDHVPFIPSSVANKDDELIILVVEDNDELRNFIAESLQDHAEIKTAANGEQAWRLIEEVLPDIIVSDVMMPVMSGLELCEKVKADIRTAHIGFLLLTAKTAQESKEVGLSLGADAYLTKPFRVKELELRIKNLLQQRENVKAKYQRELLSTDHRKKPQEVEDHFLLKLYAYLNTNLAEPALRVESLAQQMAMSKSTLNRKMRSLLGVSTSDFIQNYRLKKSVSYLESGLTIASVAYQVGFESPSYFAQCFKEVYGKTPSEFQKEHTS